MTASSTISEPASKRSDFVIKKRDGSLLALEVKPSTAVSPEDFKHIRFLSQALLQDFIRGVSSTGGIE
jgi:hypothetical protein